MVLREIGGKRPVLESGVFVDESAVVIGSVHLHEGASVWPGAVIRADDDRIEIEEGSAVMDVAFIEAPKGKPVVVGKGTIISHGARLHGCTIGDKVLVGIGAIVLDGAKVGNGSKIASGSLVPPEAEIPSNTVVMGVPGKAVRNVSKEETEWLMHECEVVRAKARRYLGK